MTYIRTLQGRLASAEEALRAKDEAVTEFRIHLDHPKFQGTDADGSRKDWIAVADVLRWLTRISQVGA
ncbi:hypothetical protein [Acidisoma sp. 7E03]